MNNYDVRIEFISGGERLVKERIIDPGALVCVLKALWMGQLNTEDTTRKPVAMFCLSRRLVDFLPPGMIRAYAIARLDDGLMEIRLFPTQAGAKEYLEGLDEAEHNTYMSLYDLRTQREALDSQIRRGW